MSAAGPAIDVRALDACPFCGHSAKLEWFGSSRGYQAVIECGGCPATLRSAFHAAPEDAVRDAMAKWNRRSYPAFETAIGSRIKARRGAVKLSIRETAELAKIGEDVLASIEAGAYPDVRQLIRLCEVLRCPISELVAFPSRPAAESADHELRTYLESRDLRKRKEALSILKMACRGPVLEQAGLKKGD